MPDAARSVWELDLVSMYSIIAWEVSNADDDQDLRSLCSLASNQTDYEEESDPFNNAWARLQTVKKLRELSSSNAESRKAQLEDLRLNELGESLLGFLGATERARSVHPFEPLCRSMRSPLKAMYPVCNRKCARQWQVAGRAKHVQKTAPNSDFARLLGVLLQ
jgi:hypothetical protein